MAARLALEGVSVTLGGVPLVRDVTLDVDAGQVHALIGESGCGKSTTTRAIVGLLPEGATVGGRITVDGAPPLRGPVTLVPADAASALDPVLSVGDQLGETLLVHQQLRGTAGRRAACALLGAVGLPGPEALLGAFPHQLSGGMQQRVLLAAALAARPRVLIADEPTAALDAPLRAQVLELLGALARDQGLAVLLTTHQLAGLERRCDQLSVMYAGSVVEQGPPGRVLNQPRHPYTRALAAARPEAGFTPLAGVAPPPGEPLPGCRFAPRCPRASAACERAPRFEHGLACHHPEPLP